MARDYDIKLPLTVPDWAVGGVVTALVGADVWFKLPADIAERINKAATAGTELVVSKADLDRLDDATWAAVNEKIPDTLRK
jgi:hypothetical protein